jgi:hypothetical protein
VGGPEGWTEDLNNPVHDYEYQNDDGDDFTNMMNIDTEQIADPVASQMHDTEQDTEDMDDPIANISKKYLLDELTSSSISKSLAETINKVFREGLNDERYQSMMKEIARPQNCEALCKIKVNPLIWNIISAQTRTVDIQFQHLHNSVIKGPILIAQMIDMICKSKNHTSDVIEKGMDALALFGQANKQLVMRRRDALKPDIQTDYGHLCSSTVPFSNFLFGDDMSKNVKDIRDMERVKKMVRKPNYGGRSRYMPYPYSTRARGFMRGGMRGRGFRGRAFPNWPRPPYRGQGQRFKNSKD